MNKHSAALLVVPLAASMLLAGCGGDAKPDLSSTRTKASSPTSTTTATPTTPASPITTADPSFPAAARAHTPAGAEAFVRYFYAQANLAWRLPKAGLISSLSLPTCKTCSGMEKVAVDGVASGEHLRGEAARADSVDTTAQDSEGNQPVMVTGQQLKGTVIDKTGSVTKTLPEVPIRQEFTLTWTGGEWRVATIKTVQ